MDSKPSVGIAYHGDEPARSAADLSVGRFAGVAAALAGVGIDPLPAVYHDDFADEFMERAARLDGLLVWVNPIENGRDRSLLDGILRELDRRGVTVSAHPDAILKMGTKQVLFDTKDMAWGSDVEVYRTLEELRDRLPAKLTEGRPRVLKRYRGHSGGGIWRVGLDREGRLQMRHALRGCFERAATWEGLFETFAPYFEGDGRIIDQEYQERLTEGMIRCYLVVDRVEGFGHQAVNALYPALPGAPPEHAPQPGPRHYYPPGQPEFQAVKRRMEHEYLPELLSVLELTREQLPLLWDADLFLGPKDSAGEDTYVLCEINVSSVSPFPEWAEAPLARATLERLSSRKSVGVAGRN